MTPSARSRPRLAPIKRRSYPARTGSAPIAQTVQPNKDQRTKLAKLRKTTAETQTVLLAACTQAAAPDPLGELDAANRRLVIMNMAATKMEIARNDLYGALNKQ